MLTTKDIVQARLLSFLLTPIVIGFVVLAFKLMSWINNPGTRDIGPLEQYYVKNKNEVDPFSPLTTKGDIIIHEESPAVIHLKTGDPGEHLHWEEREGKYHYWWGECPK